MTFEEGNPSILFLSPVPLSLLKSERGFNTFSGKVTMFQVFRLWLLDTAKVPYVVNIFLMYPSVYFP